MHKDIQGKRKESGRPTPLPWSALSRARKRSLRIFEFQSVDCPHSFNLIQSRISLWMIHYATLKFFGDLPAAWVRYAYGIKDPALFRVSFFFRMRNFILRLRSFFVPSESDLFRCIFNCLVYYCYNPTFINISISSM